MWEVGVAVDKAVVETVDTEVEEERGFPTPKGAPVAQHLFQLPKMRRAIISHIPGGYDTRRIRRSRGGIEPPLAAAPNHLLFVPLGAGVAAVVR